MRKKKSDQNAVAELTREWLYKENKWLWEENRKLKEKLSKITMVADDEKQSIEHIWELEEENENLKKNTCLYYGQRTYYLHRWWRNVMEKSEKGLRD